MCIIEERERVSPSHLSPRLRVFQWKEHPVTLDSVPPSHLSFCAIYCVKSQSVFGGSSSWDYARKDCSLLHSPPSVLLGRLFVCMTSRKRSFPYTFEAKEQNKNGATTLISVYSYVLVCTSPLFASILTYYNTHNMMVPVHILCTKIVCTLFRGVDGWHNTLKPSWKYDRSTHIRKEKDRETVCKPRVGKFTA